MSDTRDIPRWAAELGEARWMELNELLREGWDVSDIMRKVGLAEGKRRSLQVYARKFGPRRRLEMFARFKDALLKGAVDMGPDMARAMALIARLAVEPDVKESTQQRACELMNKFAGTLARVMVVDEVAEKERQREEARGAGQVDPAELTRRVLEMYGIDATTKGTKGAKVEE
jgi:hypothetical protein